MSDEISNAQTTPPAATPPSAGNQAGDIQAQVEELRKQREGLLRDLQAERAKRQELEAIQSSAASSPVTPDVNDELGKVIRPYIEPALREIAELKAQTHNEKALSYLSSKTGKATEAILSDQELQAKLMSISRKYGLVGNSFEVAQRAYEIMELEGLKAKQEESVRAAQASQAQTLPSGAPPAPVTSSRKYSAEEFNAMSPREFAELSKSGHFRKLPDGSFELNSK